MYNTILVLVIIYYPYCSNHLITIFELTIKEDQTTISYKLKIISPSNVQRVHIVQCSVLLIYYKLILIIYFRNSMKLRQVRLITADLEIEPRTKIAKINIIIVDLK